jgi:hypothetical protein
MVGPVGGRGLDAGHEYLDGSVGRVVFVVEGATEELQGDGEFEAAGSEIGLIGKVLLAGIKGPAERCDFADAHGEELNGLCGEGEKSDAVDTTADELCEVKFVKSSVVRSESEGVIGAKSLFEDGAVEGAEESGCVLDGCGVKGAGAVGPSVDQDEESMGGWIGGQATGDTKEEVLVVVGHPDMEKIQIGAGG